jgi:hypothetical protein
MWEQEINPDVKRRLDEILLEANTQIDIEASRNYFKMPVAFKNRKDSKINFFGI